MNHHPLSMSNWPKWELCPCAKSGGPETEEAKSGTRSHSWLASLISKANGTELEPLPGVTADERARAEWAYEQIAAIFGSYQPTAETQVTISQEHGELAGISGTADAVGVLPDRIVVVDFKAYSVNACDLTAQPIGYGLAVASADPFAPRTIEAVILHGGSREVQRVVVSYEDALKRAHAIISGHLANAENTDTACPNHFCQYCTRLNSCPGTDRALAVVGDESKFMAMPLAEQLVVAKQVKSICERVEKSVKAELDRQIASGVPIDEAVVAGGRAAWHYLVKPGADKLADILGLAGEVGGHGVDSAALMSLCSVSKTAICDKLVAANPGMKVAEAKRLVKPYYKPGKPTHCLERVA